jgi:hypothetical protein
VAVAGREGYFPICVWRHAAGRPKSVVSTIVNAGKLILNISNNIRRTGQLQVDEAGAMKGRALRVIEGELT